MIKMKLNLTETNLFSGVYETIWLNDYSLEDETDELKRLFSMVKEHIDEVERDNKALRAYIEIKNGKDI